MKTTTDNHNDLENQDDDIDISSVDGPEFNHPPSPKEKHFNIDARRKIESYLEDKYLEYELKDIFFDDYEL